MRLEFSPESQFDLMEIAAFIARDSPARAKSFVDELEADCGRLTTLASERRAPSWLMLCECYRTGVTSFSTGQMRTLFGLHVSCTALVISGQHFTSDISEPDGGCGCPSLEGLC